jgi:hypothetical protein
MAEFPIMLAAVLEAINDDDIELDLLNKYAFPNTISDAVVIHCHLFDPFPLVAITNYIQETVRYPEDVFKQHFQMSRNA